MFLTFPDRRSRWGARWRSCYGLLPVVPQDASSWSPPVGCAPIRHPDQRNWRRNAHQRLRGSFDGRSSEDRAGDESDASLVLQANKTCKKGLVRKTQIARYKFSSGTPAQYMYYIPFSYFFNSNISDRKKEQTTFTTIFLHSLLLDYYTSFNWIKY